MLSSVARAVPEGEEASGAGPGRFLGSACEQGIGFNEVVGVKCRWHARLLALVCIILLEGAVSVRQVRKIPKGDAHTSRVSAIPTNSVHRIFARVRSKTGQGTDTDSTTFGLCGGPAVSPWAKERKFLLTLLVFGPRDTELAPFP